MTTAQQIESMLIRNADGSVSWAPWERVPAEAICPKCGEPIRWCLDMFSFTTGDFGGGAETHPFTLAHARCVWLAEAFDTEVVMARAKEIAGDRREVGVRAAARILGVHENTVRGYVTDGRLPAQHLPGSGYSRILVSDVIAFARGGA